MSLMIPPLVFLELHFKTLLPIHNLPFYHGPHWSALFRNLLKPYIPDESLSKAGIWIHPIETGIISYEKDEPIHLGLTFPLSRSQEIAEILGGFNTTSHATEGHFQPGRTIYLEKTICRLTGNIWEPDDKPSLSYEMLKDEIEMIQNLNGFTILFYSPLRLPRPSGYKTQGHHYCDEEFFLENKMDNSQALSHLISNIRLSEKIPSVCTTLKIAGGALKWLDVPYGKEVRKTIGGVVGKLKIIGSPCQDITEFLVMGQYTGTGKNPAFGFGFYIIPEIESVRKIKPLCRGKTILERAMSKQRLRDALNKLPNSSPGPDMLSVEDIKRAGDVFLERVCTEVMNGTYRQGGWKKYRLEKGDNSFREIYVPNVTDRLVHRASADALTLPVDKLLSDSSYAYRKGLNRKGAAQALKKALSEGYTCGIKADISSFFNSVNKEKLFMIMEGLFPFEPLIKRISEWLTPENDDFIGLPQGSPLSPLLSNLYLDIFDRCIVSWK